jgi:hypothetical protein
VSELYPPIEPYETGMIDVGDGHDVLHALDRFAALT